MPGIAFLHATTISPIVMFNARTSTNVTQNQRLKMRNGNYKGGSVLTSVRIWNSTRAIQQGRNIPLGTLVNNCLDKLIHALQMGDVYSTQGIHLIERKGRREQWNEGTSSYTKIKLRRQNYDYMKMNVLNISQCVNYSVKWYGV